MASVRCPKCRHKFAASLETADSVVCPNCRSRLSMPARPKPAVVEPQPPVRLQPQPKPKPRKPIDHSHKTLGTALHAINMEELIDMTAMVDIVFFLLIFFLVTSMSVVHSSSKLPQPHHQEGNSGGSPSQQLHAQADRDEAVVTISKDDAIELDGAICHDLDDLLMRLGRRRSAGSDEISLMVVGHGDATHGTLAAVLDAAYETGFNRLKFAVRDHDGN